MISFKPEVRVGRSETWSSNADPRRHPDPRPRPLRPRPPRPLDLD